MNRYIHNINYKNLITALFLHTKRKLKLTPITLSVIFIQMNLNKISRLSTQVILVRFMTNLGTRSLKITF